LEVSTTPQQVLTGDFNLQRSSPEIKPIYKYFVDTAQNVPADQKAEFLFLEHLQRIFLLTISGELHLKNMD
jgi:hypothetical protein